MKSKLTPGVPTLVKKRNQVKSQINKVFKKHIWITATTFFKDNDVEIWQYPDTHYDSPECWKYWKMFRNYPSYFDKNKAMADCLEEVRPLINQYVSITFDIYSLESSE